MKLIVGLGNPGREYAATRHNVGFMVADEIGRRLDLQWRKDADVVFAKHFGVDAFFVVKPQTFMNRSGYAVARFAGYHNIDPRDILTLNDFGEHIYSVDFSGPDSPDGELYAASEMQSLPQWATKNLVRGWRRYSGRRSLPDRDAG